MVRLLKRSCADLGYLRFGPGGLAPTGAVTSGLDLEEMTMGTDAERLALCSEVVDKWITERMGDVEAMLAIALITEPGARSFTEVERAIRMRLEAGAPN
jgi:hypothetical protein